MRLVCIARRSRSPCESSRDGTLIGGSIAGDYVRGQEQPVPARGRPTGELANHCLSPDPGVGDMSHRTCKTLDRSAICKTAGRSRRL